MDEDSCPGKPGDLVVFIRKKGAYRHYAVNVGDGYIIHATSVSDERVGSFALAGFCSSTPSDIAVIKKQKYSEFVKPGDEVTVEDGSWRRKPPLPVEEIVKRAHSRIGQRDYSVLRNNCEHFARWSQYGEETSDQADGLLLVGAVMATLGTLAASAGVCAILSSNKQNQTQLRPVRPGDLLIIVRDRCKHYAVYVGDGNIIHATSVSDDCVETGDVVFSYCFICRSKRAVIKKEKLGEFVRPEDEVTVENGSWRDIEPLPVEEIIERARSRIGEVRDFNVMSNNCEHFARWCCYGEEKSDRADAIVKLIFGPLLLFGYFYSSILEWRDGK